jgi:hypothetical protein
MIRKSLPGLMAELRVSITEFTDDNNSDDVKLSVGHWYLIDNELIKALDPLVGHQSQTCKGHGMPLAYPALYLTLLWGKKRHENGIR